MYSVLHRFSIELYFKQDLRFDGTNHFCLEFSRGNTAKYSTILSLARLIFASDPGVTEGGSEGGWEGGKEGGRERESGMDGD